MDRFSLIRREDDGLWALPGGLTEVGETLTETAQRELREETGIRGRATQLLGIFDSRLCHSQTKAQLYHTVFLVEAENAEPVAGPETTDAAFFSEDILPPLSPGHHIRVPYVFRALRGQARVPFFDPVDQDNDRHPVPVSLDKGRG
jgi:ADP-ribose pyrophosphatase YjhB (NUDIX family)